MMRYHEFRAMNTSILLAGEGTPERVTEGFQVAEAMVHQLEQRFTRFTDTSELAELNRSAGRWFHASPEMYEVMHLAYELYSATGGLFNPAVLPALEAAGYDRSMEELAPRVAPAVTAVRPAGPAPDFRKVIFDGDNRSIYLPAGLRVDLGGIAKGWIAEHVAGHLRLYSRACVVNAGGDMFAIGLPAGRSFWTVGLEDPFHPDRDLAILSPGPGALATSTIMKRRWQQDGKQRHHLIDPRTGLPADTCWASVTVITNHAAKAEAFAKALLIAGPKGAPGLLAMHPQTAFFAIDLDGKFYGSENSRKYVSYGNYE